MVAVHVMELDAVRGLRGGRQRARWPDEWSDGRVWGIVCDPADRTVQSVRSALENRVSRERRDETTPDVPIHLAWRTSALPDGRAAVLWQVVRGDELDDAHVLFWEPDPVLPVGTVVAALTDPVDCRACGAEMFVGNGEVERLLGSEVVGGAASATTNAHAGGGVR